MGAQHTPGPLQVRMTGTCSGAWAEIGEECVDPATKEVWWRELGRVETTHVERTGPRGKRLPGPVGSIEERPERFVLTDDGAEHIANARLWATSPELLEAARAYRAAYGNCGAPAQQKAADALDAAIAKATGSA
jgi:hypothetical protein